MTRHISKINKTYVADGRSLMTVQTTTLINYREAGTIAKNVYKALVKFLFKLIATDRIQTPKYFTVAVEEFGNIGDPCGDSEKNVN